jgi:hypothetical protein
MISAIRLKDTHGKYYALAKDVIKLGRAIDNDIVIPDLNVSRYHIALQPTDSSLLVFNTGSDSGFYINNEWYMDSAVANSGDIIRIGQEEYQVEIPLIPKDAEYSFESPQHIHTSKSGNLDVTSKRTKNIRIALGLVFLAMVGLTFLPNPEAEKAERGPASITPTEGLPNDSFSDMDVPSHGPQELTAQDLYKRGMREVANNNHIRAIQYFQQSLVEDPSLSKSERALVDTKNSLQKQTEKLILDSEKNYKDTRLSLSRSQSIRALDLLSEQIPGFSFQVQQKQRTLATQGLPVLSREKLYLELPCNQTPDTELCERAVDVLKRSRTKLGEENILK